MTGHRDLIHIALSGWLAWQAARWYRRQIRSAALREEAS